MLLCIPAITYSFSVYQVLRCLRSITARKLTFIFDWFSSLDILFQLYDQMSKYVKDGTGTPKSDGSWVTNIIIWREITCQSGSPTAFNLEKIIIHQLASKIRSKVDKLFLSWSEAETLWWRVTKQRPLRFINLWKPFWKKNVLIFCPKTNRNSTSIDGFLWKVSLEIFYFSWNFRLSHKQSIASKWLNAWLAQN